VLNEIEPNPCDIDVCNVSNACSGPYRIDVFAADVTDVVTCAGGWLYDQSARGWRVTAAVADSTDPRPLRILGVHVVDLASALPPAEPSGCVLGVGSEDLESDREIRRLVLRNLRKTPIKVLWWGSRPPPDLGFLHRRAQYVLSPAACAFKQQAIHAAGGTSVAEAATEEFWCGLTPDPEAAASPLSART
jgi:hypothetical protein